MISVYGHTARTVVSHIEGRERAEEMRPEPPAGLSRNMRAAEVKLNFHPKNSCPEDGRSIFI